MSTNVKRSLKIVAALLLIGVLAWRMDWPQTVEVIRQISWWALALTLAYMAFELALSAFKWSRALAMLGLSFPLGYLWRTVCTAFFFNNFLPSAVGGDAYRIFRTLPADGYRSRAFTAILIDRMLGLLALLTLGAIASVLLWNEAQIAKIYLAVYVGGGMVGIITLTAVHFGWCKPLTNRIRHFKAFEALEHNVDRLKQARGEWLIQFGLSMIFQIGSVGIVWWLFRAMGETVDYRHCALMTAAGGVAALIPLTPGGIGLMEGSLAEVARALGVNYEAALLVAVVRRLLMVTLSMLCGMVYLAEGRPQFKPATA